MAQPELQVLDLVGITSHIAAPYQVAPLVSLGTVDVALVICEGPRTWHRVPPRRELAMVLEGVITISGPGGRVVANEGDAVVLPPGADITVFSGMRSLVVLFRELELRAEVNGYHAPPTTEQATVERSNFAVVVKGGPAFGWRPAGELRGYEARATRITGESAPYTAPDGSLIVLVYRGELDFAADGQTGTVVGSQILVVPAGRRVVLNAERGATAVLFTRAGAPLPRLATTVGRKGHNAEPDSG